MADKGEVVYYNGVRFCKYKGRMYTYMFDLWKDFTFAEWEQQLNDFQAREDDVWICSYPKAGRCDLTPPMLGLHLSNKQGRRYFLKTI